MTKNLPTTNKVTYWQPSAGETITGVIQGSGTFNNLLYDEQKTMLLQDNNGSVVSVALNRYLIHSLKQNNAALGDLVTITLMCQHSADALLAGNISQCLEQCVPQHLHFLLPA